MTAITPDRMVEEDEPAGGPCGPKRTLWISEAGGLTQFGAFIEILPPGSRSLIRHWHSAEDEMVFVIEGQVTLLEGTETILNPATPQPSGRAIRSATVLRTAARARPAAWSSARGPMLT